MGCTIKLRCYGGIYVESINNRPTSTYGFLIEILVSYIGQQLVKLCGTTSRILYKGYFSESTVQQHVKPWVWGKKSPARLCLPDV